MLTSAFKTQRARNSLPLPLVRMEYNQKPGLGPSQGLPFLLLASPAERTVRGVKEGRQRRWGGELAPEDRNHLLSTWALIVNDFISFILMHGS